MQRNSQRAGDDGNPAVAPACKWTAEGARKAVRQVFCDVRHA